MAKFPATIESLTSEWLNRVLQAGGFLESGRVSSFRAEPVSGGYTSLVYRLVLEYQGNRGNSPASMVIKLHSDSVSIREAFEELGLYEKEVRFYQNLGQHQSLPVPACYAAEFDQDSGDFVLLLEDMSAARPCSWDDDGIEDMRTGLVNLAKIHGKFWGDPQLQQHEWIVKPTDLLEAPPLKADWAVNLAKAKTRYREQLSDYTWSVCEKWLESWDEIMLCMDQDTHTLVHTDPHLGQMFFPTDALPRFVLFDWQYPSKSWAAEDVIHLVVAELPAKIRRKHEKALLDLYYQALCGQGVIDLTRERFGFQCRLSILWLLFMNLNLVARDDMVEIAKSEAEESGEDWRDWVFGVVDEAVVDWQLSEILDQAIAEARVITAAVQD